MIGDLDGKAWAGRSRARLSQADRAELEPRIAAGEIHDNVARAVGCDVRTVFRCVCRSGGLRSYERRRSPLRLSPEELDQIALGVACGESATALGHRLGRAPSTLTREPNANGSRDGCAAACRADRLALNRARG